MAEFPTYEEMAKRVAERALDEFLYNGKSIREWMRIIALEDAISRQAVLSYISNDLGFGDEENGYDLERKIAQEEIYNFVKNMKPVTPQPKTGHWIDDKCSVCGKGIEDLIDSCEWYRNEKPNFCPFCRVKLVDSQESEE